MGVEIGRRKTHAQRLAVESFGAILCRHISNDDARPADIELAPAKVLEEAHPRLGDQHQQRRVIEMLAVIDVLDVDGDFSREDEMFRQVDAQAGHGLLV